MYKATCNELLHSPQQFPPRRLSNCPYCFLPVTDHFSDCIPPNSGDFFVFPSNRQLSSLLLISSFPLFLKNTGVLFLLDRRPPGPPPLPSPQHPPPTTSLLGSPESGQPPCASLLFLFFHKLFLLLFFSNVTLFFFMGFFLQFFLPLVFSFCLFLHPALS